MTHSYLNGLLICYWFSIFTFSKKIAQIKKETLNNKHAWLMKREWTHHHNTERIRCVLHCVTRIQSSLCLHAAVFLFCCCFSIVLSHTNWHAPKKPTRTTTRHHCNYWFVRSSVNWQNNTISSIPFSLCSSLCSLCHCSLFWMRSTANNTNQNK